MRIDEFIDAANQATNSDALLELFRSAVGDVGYENIVMAEVAGGDILELPVILCPDGYPEYYFESGFQNIDPVLPLAMTTRAPYRWAEIGNSVPLNKQQRDFFEECNRIGVADGVTFPLHGPRGSTTVVSLSRRQPNADGHARTQELTVMAMVFSMSLRRLTRPEETLEPPIRLSPREHECLNWCKAGKSAWEISQILGISERTAQFHISNAMAKLGASSRIAAVVMAIQQGLLSL